MGPFPRQGLRGEAQRWAGLGGPPRSPIPMTSGVWNVALAPQSAAKNSIWRGTRAGRSVVAGSGAGGPQDGWTNRQPDGKTD